MIAILIGIIAGGSATGIIMHFIQPLEACLNIATSPDDLQNSQSKSGSGVSHLKIELLPSLVVITIYIKLTKTIETIYHIKLAYTLYVLNMCPVLAESVCPSIVQGFFTVQVFFQGFFHSSRFSQGFFHSSRFSQSFFTVKGFHRVFFTVQSFHRVFSNIEL